MRRRWIRAGLVVAITLGVVGSLGVWLGLNALEPEVVRLDRSAAQPTRQEVEKVMTTRVFFGHQSVGKNIISGIPGYYAQHSSEPPEIIELSEGTTPPSGGDGGVILHSMVGENRYPEKKLADFASTLRAGVAQHIDVAVLKFCYLDVHSGTDVDALFELYRSQMAELQAEFPMVRFVYATVPLRVETVDLKQLVKELIGRPNDNAARERFNTLVRGEYAATGRLFDIAAMQSTKPDGTRIARSHRGAVHFAMYEGYASDPGHLNAEGSMRAAGEFLAVVGRSA